MTLIKWTPKEDVLNFFDDVDKMISQAFSYPMRTEQESCCFHPYMNINETDSEYFISMDLPGVDKKNVEVSLSDSIVTVTGERNNNQQQKDNSCIWEEISHGTFQRSFKLSNIVKADKIKAQFKNGVLTLIIPKAKEVKAAVKKITVN